MPASVKVCLASRWCSASMSTVVSTPSGRMPRSSHSPETPGAGADLDDGAGLEHRGEEAQRRAAAGADRHDADLLGAGAGVGQDVVLGDELLGVGPAGGLDRRGDGGLPGRSRPWCASDPCRRLYRGGTSPASGSLSLHGAPFTSHRRGAFPGSSQAGSQSRSRLRLRTRSLAVRDQVRVDLAASRGGCSGDRAERAPETFRRWGEIVERHSARVYRLAYRLTGNRADAEDLTQEVFVRVFRCLDTYTPGTFEGWLHRITTNLFLDQARRKQRIRFDALSDERAARLPSATPDPRRAVRRPDVRRRRRARAGLAAAGLPRRRRALRRRGPDLRGDRRRSSTPSSAPSAPASTAAARCCAPRWPTGRRPRAGERYAGPRGRAGGGARDRPHRHPGVGPGRRPAPPAEAERAWAHVLACPGCRDLVEREGWVKTQARRHSRATGRARPTGSRARSRTASFLGAPPLRHRRARSAAARAAASRFLGRYRARRRRGRRARARRRPGGAPAERRPPVTSLTRPTPRRPPRRPPTCGLSTRHARVASHGVKIVP